MRSSLLCSEVACTGIHSYVVYFCVKNILCSGWQKVICDLTGLQSLWPSVRSLWPSVSRMLSLSGLWSHAPTVSCAVTCHCKEKLCKAQMLLNWSSFLLFASINLQLTQWDPCLLHLWQCLTTYKDHVKILTSSNLNKAEKGLKIHHLTVDLCVWVKYFLHSRHFWSLLHFIHHQVLSTVHTEALQLLPPIKALDWEITNTAKGIWLFKSCVQIYGISNTNICTQTSDISLGTAGWF